jgi:hypothetical protein
MLFSLISILGGSDKRRGVRDSCQYEIRGLKLKDLTAVFMRLNTCH